MRPTGKFIDDSLWLNDRMLDSRPHFRWWRGAAKVAAWAVRWAAGLVRHWAAALAAANAFQV